jgi:translation initiation factor eIF-2B subunit alpha
LTKPVAAIEALITVLQASSSTSTVAETVEIINHHAEILTTSVANPLPLIAGTELLKKYLILSLKAPEVEGDLRNRVGPAPPSSHANFDEVRQHLIQNSRLFTRRAAHARDKIAEIGAPYAGKGKVVLTHGASRAVTGILCRAAEKTPQGADVPFKVIYVRDARRGEESDRVVAELRAKRISVAEIHEAAVAHVMGFQNQVHRVFVGAEAITQNGGLISRMGTYQIAQLAKSMSIPFHVAVETHKFVRYFPKQQSDIGFPQKVLDFRTDGPSHQPPNAIDFTVSLFPHTSFTRRIRIEHLLDSHRISSRA